jgi:hypothetical protein
LTEADLGAVIPLAAYQRRQDLEHKLEGLNSQERQLNAQVDQRTEADAAVLIVRVV